MDECTCLHRFVEAATEEELTTWIIFSYYIGNVSDEEGDVRVLVKGRGTGEGGKDVA